MQYTKLQSMTVTIRLKAELKNRQDKLALITHRSKSFLASEAVLVIRVRGQLTLILETIGL